MHYFEFLFAVLQNSLLNWNSFLALRNKTNAKNKTKNTQKQTRSASTIHNHQYCIFKHNQSRNNEPTFATLSLSIDSICSFSIFLSMSSATIFLTCLTDFNFSCWLVNSTQTSLHHSSTIHSPRITVLNTFRKINQLSHTGLGSCGLD